MSTYYLMGDAQLKAFSVHRRTVSTPAFMVQYIIETLFRKLSINKYVEQMVTFALQDDRERRREAELERARQKQDDDRAAKAEEDDQARSISTTSSSNSKLPETSEDARRSE